MKVLTQIKKVFALDNPLRMFYHTFRAMIATFFFRFPTSQMIVIGVTGTDGKTTVSNMIYHILQSSGHKVGLISTLFCAINEEKWMNETKMTSLDPFMMNRYLYKMKQAGCRYVVLEVSSHAIFYNRMWGVNFDVAVMTHISSDHLDLHKTVRHYVETKKKLFTSLNFGVRKPRIPKVIVLNKDDTYFEEFNDVIVDKKYVYSVRSKASVSGTHIVSTPSSITFTCQLANMEGEIHLSVPGPFNVYNALAAISVGLSQNINFSDMQKALKTFQGLPGRMEVLKTAQQPFTVIVDYAHTVDALKKVLSMLKPVTKGKLWIVFGATGDRDTSKRPLMGKMADEYADYIIVTDDDTYTEKSSRIIEQVVGGIARTEGDRFWVIPDRRKAIETAILLAKEEDVVIITGKGAEQVQVTNEGKIPWDDRVIAKEYIEEVMKMI